MGLRFGVIFWSQKDIPWRQSNTWTTAT